MVRADAPVGITPLGKAACAALAFRVGGQMRVAVIVKATFTIAQDQPMALVDPDPTLHADKRLPGGAADSISEASDLVPYRPRADVLLRGYVRAPWGRPVPSMAVRLMVARGHALLLDKRLAVRGSPDPSGLSRDPSPFESMILAYELAARSPENPVGIPEGEGRWANIFDPRQPGRPVGFGPISPRWPSRRRLLGAHEASLDAPIPNLPVDFAWAYFNAAPEDQRIDFLRGDEWVGFEGMSAQLPRVQSYLPRARAAARVHGPGLDPHAGQPLSLVADTLAIDAASMRCWVVWRGSFPAAHEGALASYHVYAGVETADRSLIFPVGHAAPSARGGPPSRPVARAGPPSRPVARVNARPRASPQTLEMPAYPADAMRPATPFEPSPSSEVPVTLDLANAARRGPRDAPVTPFIGSAAQPARDAPRGPLPPATPFETRGRSSSPLTGQARVDVTPHIAMPVTPAFSETAIVEPPAATPAVVEAAIVEPDLPRVEPRAVELAAAAPLIVEPPAAEPPSAPEPAPELPRTLGGHFLAALARRAGPAARS